MRIEEALAQYVAQLTANGRSEHTVRQAERHIRELARWAARERVGEEIETWDAARIARFLNAARALPGASGAKRSEATLNALRSSLRSFFRFLSDVNGDEFP